ncbi:MAG: hypothetical protein QNJ13_13230 [Paracoccaceae bacterium]|nr:hypothetical protein [Paracoccaceae bacterium]
MTIAALALLAGCTEPDTYPVSGEECAPDDPVQTIEVFECDVPGGFM